MHLEPYRTHDLCATHSCPLPPSWAALVSTKSSVCPSHHPPPVLGSYDAVIPVLSCCASLFALKPRSTAQSVTIHLTRAETCSNHQQGGVGVQAWAVTRSCCKDTSATPRRWLPARQRRRDVAGWLATFQTPCPQACGTDAYLTAAVTNWSATNCTPGGACAVCSSVAAVSGCSIGTAVRSR